MNSTRVPGGSIPLRDPKPTSKRWRLWRRLHAAAVGLGLCVSCGYSPAAAAGISYGPFLTRGLTGNEMIVRWGTQELDANSTVVLKQPGEISPLFVVGAPGRDHEVVLRELALGTVYEYSVRSGTQQSVPASFSTCPKPGMPLDVVFYGDSRDDPSAHATVLEEIRKTAPDMLFESGDIAPSGEYGQYLGEFFPVAQRLIGTVPFMAAPGNHDRSSEYAGNYGAIFPSPRREGEPWRPYYSVSCGNSVFLALDSNDAGGAEQQQFVRTTLAAAAGDATIDNVFVWFHHSAYSPGQHGDNSTVQRNWVPLFSDRLNKVTAVFSGHDHIYARMREEGTGSPVTYIVSGGAGAPLYSDTGTSVAQKLVSKSSLNFVRLHIAGLNVTGTAFDSTGTVIDSFRLNRTELSPPPPPPNPPGGETGCSFAGVQVPGSGAAVGVCGLAGVVGAVAVRRLRRRRDQGA